MKRAARVTVAAAVLAWLLCDCTAGDVDLFEPEGSGLGRALTVCVELESAVAGIGEALGWADGVPEAELRVHPIGTEFRWQTTRTDSSGLGRFPDLLPRSHRLAAYRALTGEETAQLGGRRRAFGDGRMVAFSQPSTQRLQLAVDKPGSLVISEVYGTAPRVDVTQYDFHHYIELYNNADTVIYLGSKILGRAFPVQSEHPEHGYPCQASEPLRNDPLGVWARIFHQFPGSERDYPLAPGQTAVVAMDAVDHSQFHPAFPDLSQADFELIGPTDVDNPSVPNLPEVGLISDPPGHGFRMYVFYTFFLSEPVRTEELLHQHDTFGLQWVRIPAEKLLDVVATEENDALAEQQWPPCEQSVHRHFDRLGGGFVRHGDDLEYSVQRIVLDVTPGGRAILQDTNTSAVDLVRALYTVGTLPNPN